MRVTSTSYFNNIYGENNKINQQLFDVNKQIASGQKIQYSHENPNIFIDTLRLDDELTTLTQTRESAQNALKMSTQTDTTIGDMVKTLESMKVKLVNAANGTQSDASMQAIAKELRGLKNNLVSLSNTSIGGQFLFSGTATAQKPIDGSGIYQGNGKDLEAFLGSQLKQKYNISGAQMFLGEESNINRTITTNVPQFNLTDLHADFPKETYITPSSTIGDLMGNTAANPLTPSTASSYFYVQGTKSSGETFKTKISLNSADKVDTLLQYISNEYGPNLVDVTLNAHGQIEIVDKKTGSSKLDFHMVGAIDFSGIDSADVTNIDDLQSGTADFTIASNVTTPRLYVKEFTKSGFYPLDPTDPANPQEGINYDQSNFAQDGAKLTSNVSQIVNSDNSYAKPSSKLVEIGSFNPTTKLHLEGMQTDGTTSYSVEINLDTSPITVSGDLVINPLQDGFGNNTTPSDMTYQQLMDVVNMAITGKTDLATSYQLGKTSLSDDGKIVFQDLSPVTKTKATLAMYDASSSNYSGTTGSALTFNANSALTIRDPKTDFFAQIEEVIRSVEEGKTRADGSDPTD
ncbi:MAG: flagellin N-terminal helical domain-containing protein, partial [Sulfuricurvum sp.]